MNNDVTMLSSVLDSVQDNEIIKNSQESVDRDGWEVNQYLSPGSLSTMTPLTLKSIYIRIAKRYIMSLDSQQEKTDMTHKTVNMENKPVGATWI